MLRPPGIAITGADGDVGILQAGEYRSRAGRQFGDDLYAVDMLHQLGQYGGLIAGPGAHFQDDIIGLWR